MSGVIITNNPDVRDAQLAPTEFVAGTPLDVLTRARELLEEGYYLATAPLAANNRLNRNPYRSLILVKNAQWSGDDKDLLDRGISHMALQGFSPVGDADADYRWIDREHLQTALEEQARLAQK